MIISGPQKYLDQIRQAEHLRLFLDYDGTLAEFAPTPDEIYPDADLIRLLEHLKQSQKIHLSVISGRRLSHIQKLIPIDGILLAGTYGVELLTPTGKQIDRVNFTQVRPILDKIKPFWLELIQPHSGFYLEDKRWSLAIHAKDAENLIAEEILSQAMSAIPETNAFEKDFRILGGNKFLEIAPRLANKGLTIEYLLDEQPLKGALPVYIGDDDKDEEAFEKLLKYDGIAIKTCPQPCDTKAQLKIDNPPAVRQFLASLL
ncbi:MAG: trehalose-phosphatase [Anaerolineales bacterium]|nr:trehalose-phosphatase [Anaerolineales bacterium]